MVSFALLLKPSTTPEESPLHSNQLSSSGACFSSVRDSFLKGSSRDRFARTSGASVLDSIACRVADDI